MRKAAAQALGNIADPRAVEPLINTLKDEDLYVRKAAAQALGNTADPRAVEPLINTLKDEDLSVREAAADALIMLGEPAVKALGNIGDPLAVDLLIAFLEDDRWSVRKAAAEALGVIGDPQAVEPLIAALKDAVDFYETEAVAHALGTIGDPRAVESLITTLQGNSEHERQAAAEALGAIGEPALEPLLTVLENSYSSSEILAAAQALGIIGDPRAIKPLIGKLEYKDPQDRKIVISALARIGRDHPSMLLPYLKDESTVRVYLVLIVLGDPETESALIEALNAHGTDRMALDYIQCGNNNLETAAREWTSKRGYGLTGTAGPKWGSER